MKTRTLSVVASVGGALIWSGGADAAFVHLNVELHTTVTIEGTARSVWRVYANFDSPDDKVFSFGAGSSLDPMILKNRLADFSTPGNGFFNAGLGGALAPTAYAISLVPATQWDSFFTIGPWIADDAAPEEYSVTTVGLPAGNQPAGAIFSTTGVILGIDNATGVLPEYTAAGPDYKVGLMQLTVNSGEYIHGTLSLTYTSGGQNISVLNTTFGQLSPPPPPPPAPGAFALFGLASMVGPRRRRA